MKQHAPALHAVRLFLAKFQKSHLILPVSFLNAASYSGIGLAVVFYLRDQFDVTAGVIGLAAALQWGAYLAGNLLMQPLTRTLLPRYSLIISAVAASAFAFLIATANQPWTAIAAYAGVGLSAAMFWPPIMGWLSAGAEGARLNRKISRFNMSWSIGVILGPYIAGLLTEIDPGLALLAGAGGFAIVAVTVIAASFLMESIRNDSHRDPARNGVSAPDESTPLRFPSWVGMFGAYAVLGALAVTFPLYAREHLALREGVIGGVLLTRALASTVGFFLLGRTVAWHFRRVPIVVPIAVLVGASSILWLGSSLTLFAVIFPVAGLAIAGSYSASVFHGVAGSAERARRMGVHEALLTVGMIVGSLGSGVIYQSSGVNAVFLACAILLAAVLVAQVVLFLRR